MSGGGTDGLDTYQKQTRWAEYRDKKLARGREERDEKSAEGLTFRPRTNAAFNARRRVRSRLLEPTAATRNANIHRKANYRGTSSASSAFGGSYHKRHSSGIVSASAIEAAPAARALPDDGGVDNKEEEEEQGADDADDANASVVITASLDISAEEFPDGEDHTDAGGGPFDEPPQDTASCTVSSSSSSSSSSPSHMIPLPTADEVVASAIDGRKTSTGISLHVARQRRARQRKEQIRNGKAYRTKRAALRAKPFKLSTTNVGSHSSMFEVSLLRGSRDGHMLGGDGGGGHGLGASLGPSLPATDADLRNLTREHLAEMHEMQQEHAMELKRAADEAREQQEDALIRQEVALRRLFDGERRAWQDEKLQLMTLINSLQQEIAERAEARAHAETMARKMSSVVGTLEKRLLQVEQGAQDGGGGDQNVLVRTVGAELASGVRKLLRSHETNMRSLFAGREEAAMRQTEGLRVHVESTVEQSEERMSQLVENALPHDQADALGNIGDNVSHLIRLIGSLRTDMATAMQDTIRHRRQSAPTSTGSSNSSSSTESPRNSDGVEISARRSFGGRAWSSATDDGDSSLPGGGQHLRLSSYIPPTPTRPGFAGGVDEEERVNGEETAAMLPPPPTMTDSGAGQEKTSDDDEETADSSSSSSSSAAAVMRAEYIQVADGNGGTFFFNTKTQEVWTGPGTPPSDQIVATPSMDSPVVPPRDGE